MYKIISIIIIIINIIIITFVLLLRSMNEKIDVIFLYQFYDDHGRLIIIITKRIR